MTITKPPNCLAYSVFPAPMAREITAVVAIPKPT
ncbi:Uncharacterised protein [Vibrio cholerae]|nr:Uncharacterised protein [Vibrio cholerae]CSD14537.1 Uncharacterised protein [Vibrio cholerae]CSI74645.1 Uncharacterised protein [Vibrio cholerae]